MRFWWRDDDAGRDDARLEPLLALALATGRPVALAVVPTWLEAPAVERILACPLATVIQHGIAHDDHGGDGDKKVELGGGVDREWLDAALVDGRVRLEQAFGDRFRPVLAPPWNRIDDDVVARLPALGFSGLSCFGDPPGEHPLRRIDTHVDAVAWNAGSMPRPSDELLAEMRAAAATSAGAPIGLMTHHMVVRNGGWDDLDRVLRMGHDNTKSVWLTVEELFGEP